MSYQNLRRLYTWHNGKGHVFQWGMHPLVLSVKKRDRKRWPRIAPRRKKRRTIRPPTAGWAWALLVAQFLATLLKLMA